METQHVLLLCPKPMDIGFPVRRLLPASTCRSVGPFVLLDHMGPAQFAPDTTAQDVRPHPHIGLGTLTYLFSGAMMHRDNLGVVQRIEPGAVNWMCAGSGVVHSERFPEDIRGAGVAVEGIQMWIALPAAQQEAPPIFEHYPASDLPQWQQEDARWHLLIGCWGERRSPLQLADNAFYASGELAADGTFRFPSTIAERALYLAAGELRIADTRITAGTLAVLPGDSDPLIEAIAPSRLMLLGGSALDAPRHMWWNFVATSRERIRQAREDWEAGRFTEIPGETGHIPAPPLPALYD